MVETSSVGGEVSTTAALGQTAGIVVNHRPLGSVLLWSRLMGRALRRHSARAALPQPRRRGGAARGDGNTMSRPPRTASTGYERVVVSGVPVREDGLLHLSAIPDRLIRA